MYYRKWILLGIACSMLCVFGVQSQRPSSFKDAEESPASLLNKIQLLEGSSNKPKASSNVFSSSSARVNLRNDFQPFIVMVSMESKPGKAEELSYALRDVRRQSLQEPACLSYRVSQDIMNPNKFILYENWESQKEHQKQFEKPYIKNLGKKLETLLKGPYHVSFSREI